MSSPAVAGPVNGHLSPGEAVSATVFVETGHSDTDLPDAHESPLHRSSPSASEEPLGEPDAFRPADNDRGLSDSDESSRGNASEDADFDMHESVHSPQGGNGELDRDSSPDSSLPSKRKAPVSEDDFIKANPELYGLRRSVCSSVFIPMRH